MKAKIVSILLILLIIINSIPFISASADEVSYSGSDFSTNVTIASRLDEIFAEYVPGKHYFVSDGGDNLNGDKTLPCTAYGNGCGYFSHSWQCLGYVRWVQNKLFGFDEWSNSLFVELSGYSNATESNCKKWFQNNKDKLHPGAHIRFSNHSILFLSQDSNGVTFLHCNWGKNCIVKFATLSWADFASLFGSVYYCNYYKDYYTAYPENGTASTKSPGIYKTVVPNSTLNFRSEPSTSSTVLNSIYNNTKLVITKIQGNWGNTIYNGVSGWVSLDFVELIEPFTYNVEYVSDKIDTTKISFGETLIVEDNSDINDGYSFIGWNVKRASDSKWYTNNGWFSETELAKNGYEKVLFTDGDRIVVNENWIDDVTKEETFTFSAHWEKISLGIYKVITPNSTLNLRSEPSTASKVLNSIPDKTELEITEIQGRWGYTVYNNTSGWVHLDFVEFISVAPTLQSISINTAPTKTRYYIGEKFNPSGLTLLAQYSDGSKKIVTNFNYSSQFFMSAGQTDVTISYNDLTINTTVTVLPNPTITISDAHGIYGSEISVPINVTAQSYIGNGEFVIAYDSDVLEFTEYTYGQLLKDVDITVDSTYVNNKIKISFSSDNSVVSEGTLIVLKFKIKANTSSTTVSMDSMSFYTTTNRIVPATYSNSTINIFPQVTSYDNLFKNITYTLDEKDVIFTVTTPAIPLNRVKVSFADDKSGYIKYTNTHTVNSEGDYVWTLKVSSPKATTQYAFDARSDETGNYLKEYSYHTVSIEKPSAIKSVSASKNGNKITFSVVTQAGNYERLRVGLNESLVDNLAVASKYEVAQNGDYIWTITIPSQYEGTVLYFDLRDADTKMYIKNHYKYEVDLMEDVINSVTAKKDGDKIVFTVITQAGNYSRIRVGLNRNLTDNLAIKTKYTVNSEGYYVWTISIDIPTENVVLYFDLRDAETVKYINNHFVYSLDVSEFNDNVIKSVEKTETGKTTVFTVITKSGNYNRLRVGTQEKVSGNLAIKSKYTVNASGDYVWTISIETPSEDTTLYFDLRDADTNKYICQHYIYNLEV